MAEFIFQIRECPHFGQRPTWQMTGRNFPANALKDISSALAAFLTYHSAWYPLYLWDTSTKGTKFRRGRASQIEGSNTFVPVAQPPRWYMSESRRPSRLTESSFHHCVVISIGDADAIDVARGTRGGSKIRQESWVTSGSIHSRILARRKIVCNYSDAW